MTNPKPAQQTVHKLAANLSSLSPNARVEQFASIPTNQQGFVLLKLPSRIRNRLLKKLSPETLYQLIHYLDPDQTTDLLQPLNPKRRNAILKKLSRELREKVEYLLKFDPRTAAGLMSLDYIEVTPTMRFNDVAAVVLEHEQHTGKHPTILVVQEGKLLGELPIHQLALRPQSAVVQEYLKHLPHIAYNQEEAAVLEAFRGHPHNKVAVLDDDGSILGVIYSDDILQIIEHQAANTLYGFTGVHEEEDILDPPSVKIAHRYKWLILNLGTAFLAASVVGLFRDTIAKTVLLAAYMPIVAGMGGNAGSQALAVTIRGLTLKEINLAHGGRVIFNEMVAGGVNGIINGVIVALVASFWNQSPRLGLVVGVAMVINLIVAGLFGAFVPLVMQRLGKDPASSATIFITTATDVLGFFTFLGLASVLL